MQPPLESAFPPAKLCWIGQNAAVIPDEDRQNLYEMASRAFARHTASDILYAKEVLLCLAHLSLRPPSSPYKMRRHVIVSKSVPKATEQLWSSVETALRSGNATIDVFRLYGFMHVMSDFSAAVHNELSPPECTNHAAHARLQKLLAAFALETTFKVHGDACLHADIVTCMLSPFMSSTMAHLETPYQLAASSFPDQVNDMVRPLLRTSVRDRIGQVSWDQPYKMRDVIVCAGLLIELIGQKRVVIVTNATLCRGERDIPLIYVHRGEDGQDEVGVRSGNVFSRFSPTMSTAEILIKYLEICRSCNACGTSDACAVVLDPPDSCNPLFKYLG